MPAASVRWRSDGLTRTIVGHQRTRNEQQRRNTREYSVQRGLQRTLERRVEAQDIVISIVAVRLGSGVWVRPEHAQHRLRVGWLQLARKLHWSQSAPGFATYERD